MGRLQIEHIDFGLDVAFNNLVDLPAGVNPDVALGLVHGIKDTLVSRTEESYPKVVTYEGRWSQLGQGAGLSSRICRHDVGKSAR